MFSPRTWRCFLRSCCGYCSAAVFSTHVEVFPSSLMFGKVSFCFLHARGGVSLHADAPAGVRGFSPRTWRCFLRLKDVAVLVGVFSTHVEVFLLVVSARKMHIRFLHARGGVSNVATGAFQSGEVFSTHVEVFLRSVDGTWYDTRFLHARGGVSIAFERLDLSRQFSPRTWRCF